MATADEILQQMNTVSGITTPSVSTAQTTKPTSSDDILNQMNIISGSTPVNKTDNIAPDSVVSVVDTNIVPPVEKASYADYSQTQLHEYYQNKFPKLFDRDGNITNVEAARAAGILNDVRTISQGPEEGYIYHKPLSQKPDTPIPYYLSDTEQYVEQHFTLADTDLMYDSPSNVMDNAEQYSYDKDREGKTRGERVYIDAANMEKQIQEVVDMVSLSDEEREDAKSQIERDMLLDLPDDVFSVTSGREMAWHMAQNQQAFEDIDWNNPSEDVQKALADVENNMKRDKVLEMIIDDMPDGDMKKTLKILGPNGLDALMSVGNKFGYVGAKYGDGVQYLAETAQAIAPDMYEALGIGTPEEVADSAMYHTGGLLETMDAYVPAIGQSMRLPTAAARTSAKLTKSIDKIMDDMSKTTDKAELASLTTKLDNLNAKLEKSTKQELDILDAQDARAAIDTILKAESEAAWNKTINMSKIRNASETSKLERQKNAAEAAAKNTDIAEQLIDDFEARTGKTIHIVVDGKKVLEPDLARKAGVETSEEIAIAQQRTKIKDILTGEAPIDLTAARVFGQGDEITQPLLKPEKFDALVATIADLKQQYPDAFKTKTWKAGPKKGKEYTVIDHLFELTVNKQLVAGDDLIDMLNKYDISFEDYILTVVGSGSEAGRVLQKLSMIKRARPTNEMIALQEAATLKTQAAIRSFIIRAENIRRGGLVSQIATASRNLTSVFIRAPLEGFGNVLDTAMYNASQQGNVKGMKSLLSPNNWRDSFRHMKYIFSGANKDAEDLVEFMWEHPELFNQADLMKGQVNEIRRSLGRTDEMIFDYSNIPGNRIDVETTMATAKRMVENITDPGLRKAAYERFRNAGKLNLAMTILEDGVEVLNTYNRWQEFLVRRGTYLAEVERLVKREWGIDFVKTLENTGLQDFLNDATTVRPKGARSFTDILDEAAGKAMDVTYAKQPNVPQFRQATSFIVNNGLTVALPFPRFMFNSMELMGQYAAGSSIPLTKKISSIVTRKDYRMFDSRKDRERISRNLVGMGVAGPLVPVTVSSYFEEGEEQTATDALLTVASIAAAYQYRMMDGAPSDYKLVKAPDGSVVDITTQYPMRQFLYMGEATKRMRDGTFDTWFDTREFFETFLGTNIRTGVGQSILEDAVNSYAGEDLTSAEAQGKFWGGIIGNYLSSWMVPFSQIIEAERIDGSRGLLMKDASEDPTLDGTATFLNEIVKPFKQRGFFMTAEEEEELPLREYLFREEASRVSPASKVFLGLSFRTGDEEYGEYLIGLGFTDYELGSKSIVPSIRNFENKILRDFVPTIVETAQSYEETLRDEYQSNPALREKYTENEYVTDMIRPLIKQQIANVKSSIIDDKGLLAEAPDYIVPMLKFRRLGPEGRKSAIALFVREYGRSPDGSSPEDLQRLAVLGETYKKALQ